MFLRHPTQIARYNSVYGRARSSVIMKGQKKVSCVVSSLGFLHLVDIWPIRARRIFYTVRLLRFSLFRVQMLHLEHG